MRDSLPAASEVFAGLPAARRDGAALRASIRAMRAQDGRLIGVVDDDPTGSQAVHGVQVVTVLDEDAYAAAFDGPARTCFVLTNSRSLGEPAAAELTARAARGLIAVAARRGVPIDLISRSDSTLRGHVLAEVAALAAVRGQEATGRRATGREATGHGATGREATGRGATGREATGREASGQPASRGPDAVLLIPAFVEAGRVTAADIHWARSGAGLVPVGQTEFARDPAFGYAASDLRDFVAAKSGGTIRRADIASIGLTDIRLGGPERVRDLLAGRRDGAWVVVNAVEYSDLEAVACGVLAAEREGTSFLFRTGPSFVRALSGLEPKPPLRGEQIRAAADAGARGGHGLIVVGSYVGQTTRQLAALRAAGGTTDIELDVRALAGDADGTVRATARQVTGALARSDVLLYTSREFVADDGGDGLAAGRAVSAALSSIVRSALAARPAWVIAKGGITSHDVALHGLGIRRAEVAGQVFPGLISVFRPLDAAAAATGMPFVVFPGNVGGDQALSEVVAIMRGDGPA